MPLPLPSVHLHLHRLLCDRHDDGYVGAWRHSHCTARAGRSHACYLRHSLCIPVSLAKFQGLMLVHKLCLRGSALRMNALHQLGILVLCSLLVCPCDTCLPLFVWLLSSKGRLAAIYQASLLSQPLYPAAAPSCATHLSPVLSSIHSLYVGHHGDQTR